LNLRFIHAQHHRSLGRIEIKPNDLGELSIELRVAAELEALDPMGLQTVLLPRKSGCRRPPSVLGLRSVTLMTVLEVASGKVHGRCFVISTRSLDAYAAPGVQV
jgi:hypothetical protein